MTVNEAIIEKYRGLEDIEKFYYSHKDRFGNDELVKDIVIPNKIDNRHLTAPTADQGDTSQCACYSICNIIESYYWKLTGKLINLNQEQVYALAKQKDGDKNGDGTYLECAIEAAWELCGFAGKPTIKFIYNDKTINTMDKIRRALHACDFVHGGFMIKSGWMQKNNNDFMIDDSGYGIGGHAVVINYADTSCIGFQNSWGRTWGANGFALIPFQQALNQLMYCCYIENVYSSAVSNM